MWIFSVDGFDSVVEYSPPNKIITPAVYGKLSDGKTDWKNKISEPVYGHESVDQDYIDQLGDTYSPATKEYLSSHLLVRARVQDDLKPLKEFDPKAIFFEDKSADYQFRCIILRKAFADYIHTRIMQIDYWSHVKEEMEKRAPKVQGGRYHVFSKIWTAMASLQPNPPYGHTATSYYGSGYTGYGSTVGTGGKAKDNKGNPKSAVSYYTGTKYGAPPALPPASEVVDPDDWEGFDKVWEGVVEDDWDNPDDPADSLSDLQLHIAESGASWDTMKLQLKDILQEANLLGSVDLDTAVDSLVESYGTCDVENIKVKDLFDIVFDGRSNPTNS